MYTKSITKRHITVLYDKRPSASGGTLDVHDTSLLSIPDEYKKLYTHIKNLDVPRNDEVSIELFRFLDKETKQHLKAIDYEERALKYSKLLDLISTWSGCDCSIKLGVYQDWELYSREGGPIIMLKGEYVPLTKLAKEKFAGIMRRITSVTRA